MGDRAAEHEPALDEPLEGSSLSVFAEEHVELLDGHEPPILDHGPSSLLILRANAEQLKRTGPRLRDRRKALTLEHDLDLVTMWLVHAAEDEADVRITMERYGRRIMDRFLDFGIPGPKTIFVQTWHLDAGGPEGMSASNAIRADSVETF